MQVVKGILKLAGGVIQLSQQTGRSLERSVQEVVEVLQPGPMGGTAARWNVSRRADADRAVQQALENWRQLQAQHQQRQPLQQ